MHPLHIFRCFDTANWMTRRAFDWRKPVLLLCHMSQSFSSGTNTEGGNTHTHTRLTALFSGSTQVCRYQKGKTNLDL